jgi:hypothetical protein
MTIPPRTHEVSEPSTASAVTYRVHASTADALVTLHVRCLALGWSPAELGPDGFAVTIPKPACHNHPGGRLEVAARPKGDSRCHVSVSSHDWPAPGPAEQMLLAALPAGTRQIDDITTVRKLGFTTWAVITGVCMWRFWNGVSPLASEHQFLTELVPAAAATAAAGAIAGLVFRPRSIAGAETGMLVGLGGTASAVAFINYVYLSEQASCAALAAQQACQPSSGMGEGILLMLAATAGGLLVWLGLVVGNATRHLLVATLRAVFQSTGQARRGDHRRERAGVTGTCVK